MPPHNYLEIKDIPLIRWIECICADALTFVGTE